MSFFTDSKTVQGFSVSEFFDDNGQECSIQKSSSALEDKVWLGVNDPKPEILHSDAWLLGVKTDATSGWVDYPISPKVHMTTRMHLTRQQAAALAKKLMDFADSGEINLVEGE